MSTILCAFNGEKGAFADATLPSGNAAPADSEASAEQVAAAFAEKFRQVADEIRILGVYRDT